MTLPNFSRLTLTLLAALLAMAVLGGCYRKHIVSSPPAQRPAKQEEATPATPEPVIVKEELEIIEETYVVDAPDQGSAPAKVEEGDLDADPAVVPDEEAAKTNAAKQEAPVTATSPAVEKAAPKAVAPEDGVEKPVAATELSATQASPVLKSVYYVQVGAFSNMENANRALARLIADGYEGSRLVNTDDGLFRVQAGTFPDEGSAGNALEKLRADYPKGFVLKTD